MFRIALLISLLTLPSVCAEASGVKLDQSRLVGPLTLLGEDDQKIVDGAIRLIRSGDHALALLRLAELNSRNPQNSSLRILTAYTQLQLANLIGAFDEATKAEAAPNGDSYKCFFLARIALLKGRLPICRRELEHAEKAGEIKDAELKRLEKELKKAEASAARNSHILKTVSNSWRLRQATMPPHGTETGRATERNRVRIHRDRSR
jgi:hypothetical protein